MKPCEIKAMRNSEILYQYTKKHSEISELVDILIEKTKDKRVDVSISVGKIGKNEFYTILNTGRMENVRITLGSYKNVPQIHICSRTQGGCLFYLAYISNVHIEKPYEDVEKYLVSFTSISQLFSGKKIDYELWLDIKEKEDKI